MSGQTALYLVTFSRYPRLNISKFSKKSLPGQYKIQVQVKDRDVGGGEKGDAFGRVDYFCILRDRDLKFSGLVDLGVGHVI